MIWAKTVLFIVVSVVNFCKIDEPTADVVQFSQGHYGEGSLVWTFDDGIVDNSFVILELMHMLDGYQPTLPHDPRKRAPNDPLYLLAGSNCTMSRDLDMGRGTYTSASAVNIHKAPEPCHPEDDPDRKGHSSYQTMASLPIKSMVCVLVLFENLMGFLLVWRTGGCHSPPETIGEKKMRTVAMLEGRVVESLPSGKLSDDSCVIVNLSPSNSQEDLIDYDVEPFDIVDI